MPAHRLTSITIGVPNLRETAEYYLDFGLLPTRDEVFSAYSAEQLADATEYRFGTVDGGEQLRLVHSPRRRLAAARRGRRGPRRPRPHRRSARAARAAGHARPDVGGY